MSIPFRITPTTINMIVDGQSHTLTADSHVNYTAIREALKNKEFDLIPDLLDVAKTVIEYGNGEIVVKDGSVYYNDEAIHNTLTVRILEQIKEGFDCGPMVLFLRNLLNNPSKRAVTELYDFLEFSNLPITEDGHFMAYKKVNYDYTDIYTGKIDNSVGKVVSMPRFKVDDNKDITCSTGLHFCSEAYLPCFGSSEPEQMRILLLKINPADVVSIPADYNNTKGRTCRYEVVGETPVTDLHLSRSAVYMDDEEDADDEDDDDFYEDDDDFYEVDDDDKEEDDDSKLFLSAYLDLSGPHGIFMQSGWDYDELKDRCDVLVSSGGYARAELTNQDGQVVYSKSKEEPEPTLYTAGQMAEILTGCQTNIDAVTRALNDGKITSHYVDGEIKYSKD